MVKDGCKKVVVEVALTFIRNEAVVILRVAALLDQDVHLLPLQLLSWNRKIISILGQENRNMSAILGAHAAGPDWPRGLGDCEHCMGRVWTHSKHCWRIARPWAPAASPLLFTLYNYICHLHSAISIPIEVVQCTIILRSYCRTNFKWQMSHVVKILCNLPTSLVREIFIIESLRPNWRKTEPGCWFNRSVK